MLFTFLTVVHAVVAALLVTVILMQRSEGGGLTSGGNAGGLMSARGTADFLTRATTVLATLFIGLAIVLAVLAAMRGSDSIDTSLATGPAPVTTTAPAGGNAAAGADALGNGALPDEGIPLQQ